MIMGKTQFKKMFIIDYSDIDVNYIVIILDYFCKIIIPLNPS